MGTAEREESELSFSFKPFSRIEGKCGDRQIEPSQRPKVTAI